ncbi:MAG: aromatic ring-hydroxylating dioxygenase subunit alpha [Alphaproteobacteria bacterium]
MGFNSAPDDDFRLSPVLRELLAGMDSATEDFETARPLPAACYTSAEWFEFEKRAVWDRDWICLGHHGTVPRPGDYFTIEINDDPFLVVHGNDGEIRVMPAVCRHRGHILGEAGGNARQFTCPYHGWVYGLDGELLSAPQMERTASLDELREDHCLPTLRSEIWNGFIFVNLSGTARPLASRLKRLTAEVKNHRLADLVALPPIDIPDNPWNWKWMQENGVEPYHTAVAHRGYHDMAPNRNATFPDWDPEDDGAIFSPTAFTHRDANFTRTGKSMFPVLESLTEEDRWRVMFSVVPPNMLFTTLPDGAFYFIIRPAGPENITLRVGFLYPESTVKRPDFEETLEKVLEDFNEINDQDITANRAVQEGRRSRFVYGGRYGYLETPLIHFNRWLVTRFRAYAAELEGGGKIS